MLRSIVFTCLLEWDEFGPLDNRLGTLVVTDLAEKVSDAQRDGDTRSIFALYQEYRRDIGRGNLASYARCLAAAVRPASSRRAA